MARNRRAKNADAGELTPEEISEPERIARTLARVAVQLAREDAGRYMLLSEIVEHAWNLTDAAYRARWACENGMAPEPFYEMAQRVLAEFGAELRPMALSPRGVLCVRFRSGRYAETPSGTFVII